MKVTAENINTIKVGDDIIKYPTSGEPVDKIDYSDESKISRYQAIKINDKTIDLASEVIEGPPIAGMSVNMGTFHKSKENMIEEKNWWKISN